ncbi:uncharacterized protein LOC131950772 [Physella acuta]|uniref:uncharacterized protein LOC131950772 n=1 Tax=Physella acuta TaxID=109671 RepID=UPI0027DD63D7|nr:uncharacterized protein LOC131950772 [Physella acuta]
MERQRPSVDKPANKIDIKEIQSEYCDLFKQIEFTQPRAIFDRTQAIVHQATKAKNVIREAIINLDYHSTLSEEEWSKLSAIDPLKEVTSYIKEIKECLPKGKDIQLLIVGKTGQGKSVAASRIIETEDAFKSSSSTKSATDTASCKYNVIDDRLLTVVDTPGVIDTAFNAKDAASIAHAVRCISHGITLCRGGFHALVIVMKYDIRMTAEEKNAIKLIKAVLGENVLKTHGILVFTYGDTCEDFDAYLHQKHDPTFKQLLADCNYRCVLFDNKTEDKLKRKQQLIKLVKLVDSLNAPCLDNETFQRAEETRNQYIANNPLLSQAVSESMKCIETTLSKLSSNKPKETETINIKSFLDQIEHINTILSDKQGENVQNLKEGLEEIKNEIKAKGDMNITQLRNTQKVMKVIDILKEEHDKINRFVNDVVEGEVSKNSCFPSNAVITLIDGTSVYMNELQIGDKVLARDETGKLMYDEVYMFGHLEPNVLSWFVTLHTTEQHVSLSEDHLVVCKRDGQERTIPAKDIIIGDCLFVVSGKELINSPVINISRTYDKGLYAPFTKGGTIIVNNALMSCYVDVLHHDSCHKLLGPIRSLHTLCPKLLTAINQQNHSKYIPKWAEIAIKVIRMFKKQAE